MVDRPGLVPFFIFTISFVNLVRIRLWLLSYFLPFLSRSQQKSYLHYNLFHSSSSQPSFRDRERNKELYSRSNIPNHLSKTSALIEIRILNFFLLFMFYNPFCLCHMTKERTCSRFSSPLLVYNICNILLTHWANNLGQRVKRLSE